MYYWSLKFLSVEIVNLVWGSPSIEFSHQGFQYLVVVLVLNRLCYILDSLRLGSHVP